MSCTESLTTITTYSHIDDSSVSDFDHQIAGHTRDLLRRYLHQYVLKPQNKDDLFQREVRFYEEMFGDPQRNARQISFLPAYHGVVVLTARAGPLPHLMLDDLTTGYCRPCVIDIKMGRESFEPSASLEKKEREICKYPYQAELGFRITGLKVWDEVCEQYHCRNKAFGRSVTPEHAAHALACCFFNGRSIRADVIACLLLRLEAMLGFMRVQAQYKFYCSSILVVYDAASAGGGSGGESEAARRGAELFDGRSYCGDESDLCRSAMIDFARAVPSSEVDEGYVHGLEVLIDKLRAVLAVAKDSTAVEIQTFESNMHAVFSA